MHKDIQAVRSGVDIGAALRLLHDAGVEFADLLPAVGDLAAKMAHDGTDEEERRAFEDAFARLGGFDTLGAAGGVDCWTEADAPLWPILRGLLRERTNVFSVHA